ncbi:MAG: hypothetical protein AAF399_09405 [Bacteroidota bacterium]
MKRSYWLIYCLFSACSLFSQPIRSDTLVQDFNQDGVADSLLVEHASGSWMAGEGVLFWDGKSGETNQFYTEFYFGSFWHIIDLPDDFWQKEYRALREALAPATIQLDHPLPALQWLIDATYFGTRIEDETHVDWRWKRELQWEAWPPVLDTIYFVEIDSELSGQLTGTPTSTPSWISYFGHNHRSQRISGENDGTPVLAKKGAGTSPWPYEICTTAHGVLIKREEQFAWAFINDAKATEGTGKLRWPAITGSFSWGSYLIIVQDVPLEDDEKLWSLHLETGELLRWKTPEDAQIHEVEVVNDQLQIQLHHWETDGIEIMSYDLEAWENMLTKK